MAKPGLTPPALPRSEAVESEGEERRGGELPLIRQEREQEGSVQRECQIISCCKPHNKDNRTHTHTHTHAHTRAHKHTHRDTSKCTVKETH